MFQQSTITWLSWLGAATSGWIYITISSPTPPPPPPALLSPLADLCHPLQPVPAAGGPPPATTDATAAPLPVVGSGRVALPSGEATAWQDLASTGQVCPSRAGPRRSPTSPYSRHRRRCRHSTPRGQIGPRCLIRWGGRCAARSGLYKPGPGGGERWPPLALGSVAAALDRRWCRHVRGIVKKNFFLKQYIWAVFLIERPRLICGAEKLLCLLLKLALLIYNLGQDIIRILT